MALFYPMALGALACAIGVVSAKNPIWSVLSLLGSFFCLAAIYLLAGFQFMAAAQILVYAGAIMVLFLFVIMLLNLGSLSRDGWLERSVLRARRMPLVMSVCAALFALTLIAIGGGAAVQAATELGPEATPLESVDSAKGLSEVLFSRYLLAFEAASVLLLAAAVAVMVLAKRERGAPSAALKERA